MAGTISAAEEWLKVAQVDLLLSHAPPDLSALSWLVRITVEPKTTRKILIVTNRREPGLLESLRKLPIGGIFDTATDGRDDLLTALRDIYNGTTYWSKSVTESILQECLSPRAPLRRLTPTERKVFSAIADGKDDKTAGAALGLRPNTVASVRREIHRKLNVRHRGELMRLGMQYGIADTHLSSVST